MKVLLPSAVTYTTSMNRLTFGAAILALCVLALFWTLYPIKTPDATSPQADDESDIRTLVTEFGTKLKMVPLLAPEADRKRALNEHYARFVSPELLTQWYAESAENRLGLYASSPWPEKIDIVEIRMNGKQYIVEANIIEYARTVGPDAEPAAVQPITLTLEKRGASYLIVDVSKGSYSELPQRRSIIGYWECLPPKDTAGPITTECAFGIAVDQSDGHYAVNTQLMSTYPVDVPTGTKVRVEGVVTPASYLSSLQKYDIDGIIHATIIEKVE